MTKNLSLLTLLYKDYIPYTIYNPSFTSMNRIACIIVDDEELALDVLEAFINRLADVNLLGRFTNAFDALDFLQTHAVDLIFTDIEMPQVSGIEMIRSLSSTPEVIFTTAYPIYAVDGFELSAVDYLLKPISYDRFTKAIHKFKSRLLSDVSSVPLANPERSEVPYMFVRENAKVVQIFFNDILWVEGLRDYVKIVTSNRTIITHTTMKRMEELLPSLDFVRTQRSYIVRIAAIKAINGNMIEMKDGSQIQIGLQYRDQLMNVLKPIN